MEYGISGCDAIDITRLRGEMVGIVCHPLGLQDSGTCWEWGRYARFRGKISGDGPPTWSDRCYPNLTYAPCSDPGCHASWVPHDHCVPTDCLAGPSASLRGPMPCTAGSSFIVPMEQKVDINLTCGVGRPRGDQEYCCKKQILIS